MSQKPKPLIPRIGQTAEQARDLAFGVAETPEPPTESRTTGFVDYLGRVVSSTRALGAIGLTAAAFAVGHNPSILKPEAGIAIGARDTAGQVFRDVFPDDNKASVGEQQ